MYARKSQQQDKLSAMALMLTMPFSKGLPRPPRRCRLGSTHSVWSSRKNQIMMSLLWKYEIISMYFHEKQIRKFCSYKWKVPLFKNQKRLSHSKSYWKWKTYKHFSHCHACCKTHFKTLERRPVLPLSGTSVLSKVTISTRLRSCYLERIKCIIHKLH